MAGLDCKTVSKSWRPLSQLTFVVVFFLTGRTVVRLIKDTISTLGKVSKTSPQ